MPRQAQQRLGDHGREAHHFFRFFAHHPVSHHGGPVLPLLHSSGRGRAAGQRQPFQPGGHIQRPAGKAHHQQRQQTTQHDEGRAGAAPPTGPGGGRFGGGSRGRAGGGFRDGSRGSFRGRASCLFTGGSRRGRGRGVPPQLHGPGRGFLPGGSFLPGGGLLPGRGRSGGRGGLFAPLFRLCAPGAKDGLAALLAQFAPGGRITGPEHMFFWRHGARPLCSGYAAAFQQVTRGRSF